MPPRGYVLILVSWALLTVITPTLIYWSASAKSNLVAPGGALPDTKVSRRMMGSTGNGRLKKSRRRSTARAMVPAADPAPAPMAGDDAPGQS
ncbi:hypothetical protein MUK42_00043 [Musa troglodytarum]|uniref:Uncharacterized protein n=1 Tax=Musa troglodytarum TaxID=320322 RepID=A0A9E7F967_9LILI|nr:hypothetical protein MUK42_00043 [Musa troglodytarum]